jgi:hypothetical protein
MISGDKNRSRKNMESSKKILPPYTYWVIPGKILAGEHPGHSIPEKAEARIKLWMEFGIEHFVDLTEPDELESYHHLVPESDGYTVSHFPIPDVGIPPKSMMIEILDDIDAAIEKGRIVYLHCRGGIGRTGTVIGCYFSRHGDRGKAALQKLERVFDDFIKSSYARSPETPEQRNYVIEWEE